MVINQQQMWIVYYNPFLEASLILEFVPMLPILPHDLPYQDPNLITVWKEMKGLNSQVKGLINSAKLKIKAA